MTVPPPRSGLAVVAICFLTIVFHGYDLIVYGSVLPSLLAEPGWGIGPAQAGAVGSYALAGMLIGALVAGAITEAVGRRRIVLAGIVWFSVAMGLCALAPSAGLLGLFRFLAGLGLGGVLPSAIALTVEYAPRGRRQLYNALTFAGYSVGGVLAAVLALVVGHGWRIMFWIGVGSAVRARRWRRRGTRCWPGASPRCPTRRAWRRRWPLCCPTRRRPVNASKVAILA